MTLLHYSIFMDLRSVLLGITIFLVMFWWFRQPRHKNLPPGPINLPIVGTLLSVGVAKFRTGDHSRKIFARMSRTYGKVFSIYFGSQRVVVLNGYECIREAFQNPLLLDRPEPRGRDPREKGQGLVTASGILWTSQRKFTVNAFRDIGIGKTSFQDNIADETSCLIDELIPQLAKPIDLRSLLTNSIANVISMAVFGKRFEYGDKQLARIIALICTSIKRAGKVATLPLMFPILKKLDFREETKRAARQQKANQKDLTAYIASVVAEHKEKLDPDNINDYVDVYLNELQPGGSLEHIGDTSMVKTILQLYAAATDTTVNTILWALAHSIKHPDIQNRIYREIDEVVGRNRQPRLSDKLPYIKAFLLEVNRVATVASLGVPHCATEDTTIQGFNIPKGTTIISNLWAVNHDPNLWKDPEEFRPERFLNEEGAVIQPAYLIPFGTGRRNCPGQNLAVTQVFTFFTHLMQRFTVAVPEGHPPLSIEEREPGWVNMPGPFEIMITERE